MAEDPAFAWRCEECNRLIPTAEGTPIYRILVKEPGPEIGKYGHMERIMLSRSMVVCGRCRAEIVGRR